MSRVVVIGPQAPPVHGLAMVTGWVVELLELSGHEIVRMDRTPRGPLAGRTRRLGVIAKFAGVLISAVRERVQGDYHVVYVASSGGPGIVMEAMLARVLARKGVRVLVHHHSFAYLSERSAYFRIALRLAYARASHVALCDFMSERLVASGVPDSSITVVSNAALMPKRSRPPSTERAPESSIIVGHLSNLTVDKGLDTVLEVLKSTPNEVEFKLCGNFANEEARRMVTDALTSFGGRLSHVTPNSREDVWGFLAGLDLFLFPSRYFNEAEPLVVFEALSSGIPVMTSSRGCMASQLSPHLRDKCVEIDEFRPLAVGLISQLLGDPSLVEASKAAARMQWSTIVGRSEHQRERLLEHFKEPAVYGGRQTAFRSDDRGTPTRDQGRA